MNGEFTSNSYNWVINFLTVSKDNIIVDKIEIIFWSIMDDLFDIFEKNRKMRSIVPNKPKDRSLNGKRQKIDDDMLKYENSDFWNQYCLRNDLPDSLLCSVLIKTAIMNTCKALVKEYLIKESSISMYATFILILNIDY
jgi:hypothetical protein